MLDELLVVCPNTCREATAIPRHTLPLHLTRCSALYALCERGCKQYVRKAERGSHDCVQALLGTVADLKARVVTLEAKTTFCSQHHQMGKENEKRLSHQSVPNVDESSDEDEFGRFFHNSDESGRMTIQSRDIDLDDISEGSGRMNDGDDDEEGNEDQHGTPPLSRAQEDAGSQNDTSGGLLRRFLGDFLVRPAAIPKPAESTRDTSASNTYRCSFCSSEGPGRLLDHLASAHPGCGRRTDESVGESGIIYRHHPFFTKSPRPTCGLNETGRSYGFCYECRHNVHRSSSRVNVLSSRAPASETAPAVKQDPPLIKDSKKFPTTVNCGNSGAREETFWCQLCLAGGLGGLGGFIDHMSRQHPGCGQETTLSVDPKGVLHRSAEKISCGTFPGDRCYVICATCQ